MDKQYIIDTFTHVCDGSLKGFKHAVTRGTSSDAIELYPNVRAILPCDVHNEVNRRHRKLLGYHDAYVILDVSIKRELDTTLKRAVRAMDDFEPNPYSLDEK
jgi:hypothetical protein